MTTAVETRIVVTPHIVSCDGQTNTKAVFEPGEKLHGFLRRNVEDIDDGRWAVAIGGRQVPRHLWALLTPKNGQLIEVRAVAGKQALYIVALAALTYFTFGAGATAGGVLGSATGAGTFFGAAGLSAAVMATAVFMGGPSLGKKVIE